MRPFPRISLGSIMKLRNLKQTQIDWIFANGVSPRAIICPTAIMTCRGERAKDGRFDENPDGLGSVEIHFELMKAAAR